MPSNDQFDYQGIKVQHSGNWNRQDYHDHNKVHLDKSNKEIQGRSLPVVNRQRDKLNAPKPETKIVDLATNKKTPIDLGVQQAHNKELKNRGL